MVKNDTPEIVIQDATPDDALSENLETPDVEGFADEQASDAADPALFGAGDNWETVAARLGVETSDLFAWNTGLGGCFSIDMVPTGQIATHPDVARAAHEAAQPAE